MKKIKDFNKMTLDECWRECLRMWYTVSKKVNVPEAKSRWCKKNYPGKHLHNNCFFCHYSRVLSQGMNCKNCPGVLIDSTWRCNNDSNRYYDKPKEFYKSLKQLNKIRLGKNARQQTK